MMSQTLINILILTNVISRLASLSVLPILTTPPITPPVIRLHHLTTPLLQLSPSATLIVTITGGCKSSD